MRVDEACARYGLKKNDLRFYADGGILEFDVDGNCELSESDIRKIRTISLLNDAGLPRAGIVRFFLSENFEREQIRILKDSRGSRFDDVCLD